MVIKSAEYGFRGIITCLNGEYSYFDFIWSGRVGELKFCEQDFDNDGMAKPYLLVEQDGKIYVHTYSYDYVIEIDS